MSKMGSHDPFGYLKHKLWPKERSRVKLTVWLLTTKSQESTQFPCVQVACNIPLKSSKQGIQLYFRPHLNQRSTHKVMGPQSCGSPKVVGVLTLGISKIPFGSPGTKCHLDLALIERHRVYCKGEGGGFPQIWVVVDFVNPSLLMVRPSTKSAPTMH